jgi:dTDP-4-amino-4,6-dideoxygalactose transaminase
VAFLDLAPQHRQLQEDLERAVLRVLRTQQFVLGPEGKALEAECAAWVGAKHGVGCASGSDALLLALRALDVGAADAIVTTPFSFFATAGAAARAGIRVDFADVEPGTLNLDPASLEAFLARCKRDAQGVLREPREGRRVAAVISVDLFGRPCDYAGLEAVCARFGLPLIEDAAQSFGARQGSRRCGRFGRVACFSFYPTKNLGGAGDGGLLTTDDEALAARLRSLRVHGSSVRRYVHEEVGWNSRLDELQAAVVRVKLPHLERWNAARRVHAQAYDQGLSGLRGVRPLAPARADEELIYHLYVVRAERRDALQAHLAQQGVQTGVYYPIPLHLQECFRLFGYRAGDLPQAEAAAQDVLALPMYPELPAEARERVVEAIRGFYRG